LDQSEMIMNMIMRILRLFTTMKLLGLVA